MQTIFTSYHRFAISARGPGFKEKTEDWQVSLSIYVSIRTSAQGEAIKADYLDTAGWNWDLVHKVLTKHPDCKTHRKQLLQHLLYWAEPQMF